MAREDERELDETAAEADGDEHSGAAGADERAVDSDADEAEMESPDDEERDVDKSATSFVEVEQELGHLGEGMRAKAQAIDVEQVPASEVPEDYPVAIGTPDALELTLELLGQEGRTVLVYFEWPDQGPSDRLATLLELSDVAVDRFGDLHGKTILVTVEDGYYLPVLPEAGLRGDERAVYALAAGLVPPALVTFVGIFGIGTSLVVSTPFILLWLLSTFLIVPLALYSDAWYLRTHSDWDGGPLFWASMAVVPMLELVIVPLYLLARANAEPLA